MKSSGKTKTPPGGRKKRRGIRLNRPCDVKRLLNRSINEVLNGEMDTDTLRAVSYSCQIILKIYEILDIEKRFMELETKLTGYAK